MLRNFMKDFEDDPFFSDMPSIGIPSLALFDGQRGSHGDRAQQNGGGSNAFSQMFQSMDQMHKNMMSNFEMRGQPGMDGHSYTSSSVMTYTNDGKSKPKYYQATSSTRTAPGQLRETRRTVKDSQREIEKMAIGHHIGEKGRVLERRRIRGEEEEERNYYHMNEADEPHFEEEWKRKSSHFMRHSPTQHGHHQRSDAGGLGATTSHPYLDRPAGGHKQKRSSGGRHHPDLAIDGERSRLRNKEKKRVHMK